MPIRVSIVDDDDELRNSICDFLEIHDDFECIHSVDSVENFLYETRFAFDSDLILMDIELPGMSGIQGIQLLRDKDQDVNIIMLTVHDDPERIFSALRAGASGYLLKSTPLTELIKQFKLLFEGGAPMSHQIALKVIEYFRPKEEKKKKSPLSEREKEVVMGLVDGLSYKGIAARLTVSMGTIHTHIRNIYRKLHVNSKADVVRKSLKGEI